MNPIEVVVRMVMVLLQDNHQGEIVAKRFIAMATEDFLKGAEERLADHVVTSKAVQQRRQEELKGAGVLVKRGPAAMTAKKKRK